MRSASLRSGLPRVTDCLSTYLFSSISHRRTEATFDTVDSMEFGYARVSTSHQDLERQLDALEKHGIPRDRIYVDKRTGANVDRPGWQALDSHLREGDTVVVYTLDRAGRSVLAVLQAIAAWRERGVGIRTLADPIAIDTGREGDAMSELAIILISLFAQWELTYSRERAAHARRVAAEQGRQVGRPSVVDSRVLARAVRLRDTGATMADIVAATGLSRATLYRHLPPRPGTAPTANG